MTILIEDDFTMKIRKSTTGKIQVEGIPDIFENGTAKLIIKANDGLDDEKAILTKNSSVFQNTCEFKISVEDSEAFALRSTGITKYKWLLRITNATGDIAHNIVPQEFDKIPNCIIYP